MNKSAILLQVKLMYHEATSRLSDADLLSSSLYKQSDSDYLIRILAFEILLKGLCLINMGDYCKGHNYKKIFYSFTEPLQKSLIASASERMGGAVNYTNISKLLECYGSNFIDLRYPHERYRGDTETAYIGRGNTWMENGALLEEATFVYYPTELTGLIYAASSEIESWLNERQIAITQQD